MNRFQILEDDEVERYETLDDALDALEDGRRALRWTFAALVGESIFIASMLLVLVVSVVFDFERAGWFAAMMTGGLGVYGYLFFRTWRALRDGRRRRERLEASIDEALDRDDVARIEDHPAARVPRDVEERSEFGRLDRRQRGAYALVVVIAMGFPALIHFGPSEWDAFNIMMGALVGLSGVASARHMVRRGPSHRLETDALYVVGSALATEIRIPWSAIDHVRLSSGLATTLEIEVHDRRKVRRAHGLAGTLELGLGGLFGRDISVAVPGDVDARDYLALLRSRIRRVRDQEVRATLSQSPTEVPSVPPSASPGNASRPEEDSGSGK